MLYLHGGWVRTGTSSLQAALIHHRDQLTAEGIIYPDRWREPPQNNHHGIIRLLQAGNNLTTSQLAQFQRNLESFSGDSILLSSESLTYWLVDGKLDTVLRVLAAAQEVMPVTFLWTLRSLPEFANSLYLRRILIGRRPPPIREFVEHLSTAMNSPTGVLAGLRRLEDATDKSVYLEYAPRGGHYDALLDTVGVSSALSASIKEQTASTSKLNASLSQKAAVVLLHRDAISTQVGFPLNQKDLRELFSRGEFSFAGDRQCQLADDRTMQALHDQTLAGARRVGFAPYLEFFGDQTIVGPPSVDLDPDILTQEDLRSLVARLRTVNTGADSVYAR